VEMNALTLGRAQLVNLGDTKTFGPSTVNELRLSYMRDSNNVGQPAGGVGPSLASQGFVTGIGTVSFRSPRPLKASRIPSSTPS